MADRRRDRFPELLESELTTLLDQKNSDNTKKATKVFRDYLIERKIDEDSLVASKDKLATILRNFYAEARKKKRLTASPKKLKTNSMMNRKQLLNSVIAKFRLRQIIDLLATYESRYFAQPRPIIVNYLQHLLTVTVSETLSCEVLCP